MLLRLFDQRFGRRLIIVVMKNIRREKKAYVIELSRKRNGSHTHFTDFMIATN